MDVKILDKLLLHPYYKSYTGDFYSFPIISKSDANAILALSNGDITTRTSGSSGSFLNIKWWMRDHFISNSYLWKIRAKYGVKPSDIYITNHAVLYDKELFPSVHSIIVRNNCISFSKTTLNETTLSNYVKTICEKHPQWLLFQPSFALILGEYCKKHNIKLPNTIKLIELTGEFLESNVFSSLQKLFNGIPIKNLYGMQEFNGIAYGDDHKLEILQKNVFVEILDDSGNKVSPSVPGNIVVTGYSNTAMPLIRYKTGDVGCWIEEGKSIQLMISKSNDCIITDTDFYDGSIFLTLTEKINHGIMSDIVQFQYILKNNILNCYFNISDEGDEPLVESLLYEYVKKLINHKFDGILLHINDTIPQIRTEKIKYFINEDRDN